MFRGFGFVGLFIGLSYFYEYGLPQLFLLIFSILYIGQVSFNLWHILILSAIIFLEFAGVVASNEIRWYQILHCAKYIVFLVSLNVVQAKYNGQASYGANWVQKIPGEVILFLIILIPFQFWTDNFGVFGVPRFSGLLWDPNFTAFVLGSLIVLSKSYRMLFMWLLLTQSLSILFSFVLDRMLGRFGRIGFVFRILLLMGIILIPVFIFFVGPGPQLEADGWIAQRLKSLELRLSLQVATFALLWEHGVEEWMFGFGYGNSLEMLGGVSHSAVWQQIFHIGLPGTALGYLAFYYFTPARFRSLYWFSVLCSLSIDIFNGGLYCLIIIFWCGVEKCRNSNT